MKKQLVLLHGWGFQSNVWNTLTPYFSNQIEITTLDLPGFGKTPLPKQTLTLKSMTQFVLDNAPESAVFIGWSLGGLVAMNIAMHHSERIQQLVTFASTPKFVATDEWPGMSPEVLDQFYQALKIDFSATLQQFALLQFHGSQTDRSMVRATKQLVLSSDPPSERALYESLNILKDTDLRNKVATIQCPQHYFFGRCDTLVPEAVANKISEFNVKANIEIIPRASHAPFLSAPETCAKKIEAIIV